MRENDNPEYIILDYQFFDIFKFISEYKVRVGIVPSRRSSRVLGRTRRDSIEWSRPQNIVRRPSDELKTNRDDFLDHSDDTGRYDIAPKILEDDIGRRTDEFRRNIIEQGCHGIMSRDLKGVKYIFMLEIHFCSCLFYLPHCNSDIERDSLLPSARWRCLIGKRNFSHVVREIAREEVVLGVMLWCSRYVIRRMVYIMYCLYGAETSGSLYIYICVCVYMIRVIHTR